MLSLWSSKSLIGPQGIYQLWKYLLFVLTMLENQSRGRLWGQRGTFPRGQELPLGAKILGARILIHPCAV